MYSTVDLCLLCLINNKNLKSILSKDSEGIVIKDKCRFVLNEHVPIKPEVSFICLHCLENLNYVYKFKQTCLQNIYKFNNYVDTLRTNKHLKVSLTNILFQKVIKLKRNNDNESANEIYPPIEVVIVKDEIIDNSDIKVENVFEEEKEMREAGLQYQKMIELTYDNETANEIFPSVLAKEEIADKSEIKEEDVSENEKGMHQDDEFSGTESPKNINNDTNMQSSSSLCEDSHIEHFLKKVKEETGLNIVHEEFHVKDEQLFQATDSASQNNLKEKLQNDVANNPENISTSSSYSETSNNSTQFDKKTTKAHKCDVCNKTFIYRYMLVTHYRVHTEEKPYKCDVCQKTFKWKHNLVVHKHLHTPENPFKKPTEPHKCNVCNRTFIHRHLLVKHKRAHSETVPYKCDVCQRAFNWQYQLDCHKRIHTGEKPYGCDVCQKAFIFKCSLIKHKRSHTGEYPYECDVCTKTFVDLSSLTCHKRIHSEENPNKCDVCNKAFSRKQYLKIHKRSHTGEKPYECEVCQKSFSRPASLARHAHVHTGEKPYACDVCNMAFARKSHLTIHKKRRHALTQIP